MPSLLSTYSYVRTFTLRGRASESLGEEDVDVHECVLSLEGKLEVSHFVHAIERDINTSLLLQFPADGNIMVSLGRIWQGKHDGCRLVSYSRSRG